MYSIGIVMYTLLCSCDPNPFADDGQPLRTPSVLSGAVAWRLSHAHPPHRREHADRYFRSTTSYRGLFGFVLAPLIAAAWQRYLVDTYVEGQVFRRGFNSTAPFPRSGVEAARTGADADANVDMMRQLFGQIRAQYRAYPWMMPCGTQDEASAHRSGSVCTTTNGRGDFVGRV